VRDRIKETPSWYHDTQYSVLELKKEMFFEKNRHFAELLEQQKQDVYNAIEKDYSLAIYTTFREYYDFDIGDENGTTNIFIDMYEYTKNPNVNISPLNKRILRYIDEKFDERKKEDFDNELLAVRTYRLYDQFPHIYVDEIAREIHKADFGKRALYESSLSADEHNTQKTNLFPRSQEEIQEISQR